MALTTKPKAVKAKAETKTVIVDRIVEKPVILDRAVLEKRRKTMADPTPPDLFQQAADLVRKEKMAYEDSSRLLKNTVQRVYKNYLGVFDEPYDPYTNRKKVFTPLTHNIVDAVSKGVSVTSQSIRIKPITEESRGAAKLLNMVLPYFFQQMGFDQMMKLFTHRVAWLGTQITVQDWLYRESESATGLDADTKQMNGVPKEEKESKDTKKVVDDRPRITLVNVMDVFTPCRAESISACVRNASVILRSTMPLTDVQSNPRYSAEARAKLEGYYTMTESENDATALNRYAQSGYRNEARVSGGLPAETKASPEITVYTRFGKIPKSWITKDEKDALVMVDGLIECAANNSDGANMDTLCIRLSPFGEYGPLEDCRFNVIPERYLGEGVGERLIPLQAWQNEVVNIRRGNEVLFQQGMYKYKKGTIDTKQLFARPGGGIAVDDMKDVERLDLGDVKQSSFVEDQNIENMGQKLAGIAMTPIQKSMTATEANGIQQQQTMTYNELKDTIEMYVERLVLKHMIPLLKRYLKGKKTIPVTLPLNELEMLDTYNGYSPFHTKAMGAERFLLIDSDDIFDGEFAVSVEIEESNKNTKADALFAAISLGAKIQNSGLNIQEAFRKMLEIRGVVDDRLFEDATVATPTGVTNPNQGATPPLPQVGATQTFPTPQF